MPTRSARRDNRPIRAFRWQNPHRKLCSTIYPTLKQLTPPLWCSPNRPIPMRNRQGALNSSGLFTLGMRAIGPGLASDTPYNKATLIRRSSMAACSSRRLRCCCSAMYKPSPRRRSLRPIFVLSNTRSRLDCDRYRRHRRRPFHRARVAAWADRDDVDAGLDCKLRACATESHSLRDHVKQEFTPVHVDVDRRADDLNPEDRSESCQRGNPLTCSNQGRDASTIASSWPFF